MFIEVPLFQETSPAPACNIAEKLGIEHVPDDESNLPNINDPILKAIAKYENHPSILRIKNYMKEKDLNFSFEFVAKLKISKEIN